MNNEHIIDGRYEIIETIGKGGMAIVYKAKCLVLNRYVAIKVLRPEYRDDSDFIKRFRAEAQSAGGLSHPNIVSVYDVALDGDIDYIAMEYVEGVTLKQYIDAKGIIPWKEAVDYGSQICAGLEHAHQKGIVHKDIKPHNIMITREGVLKITDFGIAKAIDSGTIASNTTTIGSVHYCSPEQARGGYTDTKTDIYSLGVLLYEMVTGSLPFDGDSAVSVAMQHIEKDPEPPKSLNNDIPQSFENVILKAMCKSPIARYESATRMLVDLKKVYIGAEVTADFNSSGETTVIPKFEQNRKPDITDKIPAKKKKEISSKKSDLYGILAGIATGIVLIAIIGFFILNPPSFSLGGEKLELPDFSGMTIDEAKDTVINSEIEIIVEKEIRDETKGEGVILSQDPAPQEKVKANSTVKVVINAAAQQFTLPSVINRTEEEAQTILADLNLNVSVRTEPSDIVAEGYVISQLPDSGNQISKGGYVTITVSSGKDEIIVPVPNLIDLPLESAKSVLLENNLVWGSIIYIESDKPVNTVVSQEIRPKKEVKEKTSIDLRVSRGPVSVPPTNPPVVPPTEAPAPVVVDPIQPAQQNPPVTETTTDTALAVQ
ncbi:MAG: Stk1 family PASTA domain-containing Ser/Thr kinase [Clostridia bacterium]|nr:Stk1 family PASTA domain-containing Ser/Thr kinase [Clostridia bacterium]